MPSIASAIPLVGDEYLSPIFSLDNGSRGSGTAAFSETGYQRHGAFGFPTLEVGPRRYFQGEATEAQTTGTSTLSFKNFNGSDPERITDHFPNRGPLVSETYFGGGNFDGTALELTSIRFDPGLAPAIGLSSPPATGTANGDPNQTAGTGVDIRRPDAGLATVPWNDGETHTAKYAFSAQVYVPSHAGDLDTTATANTNMHAGAYVDRLGFGLVSPGGQALNNLTFTADQFDLLEVRVEITTNGNGAGNTDDTAQILQTFYINGVQIGGIRVDSVGNPHPAATGVLRFSPGFGLQRGYQGSTAESYLDNITLSQILVPEPAGLALLGAGVMGLIGRRRRKS